MILESKKRFAAVSTEFAIGTALAVVALFIALGLFYDNLSGMLTSTGLTDFFNGNDAKTEYSAFNRNYSDSEINVQIMGEQGLEMLRRRANNKAIELIENPFTNDNAYGDSIAYLATAIKAIASEPNICVYMKKNSDKLCKNDDIGGYNYNVEVSGSAVTITKQNTDGSYLSPSESIVLNLSSTVQTVLADANQTMSTNSTNSAERNSLTEDEKYSLIKEISTSLVNYVRSDALLIRTLTTFTTSTKFTKTTGDLKTDLTNLLSGLITNVNIAHESCVDSISGGYWPKSATGCCDTNGLADEFDPCWVNYYENNKFATNMTSLIASLKEIDSSNSSSLISTFITGINNNFTYYKKKVLGITIKSYSTTLLKTMEYDHRDATGEIRSCTMLTDGLDKINSTYNLGIDIPTCTPTAKDDELEDN
jgi:hypothetical protein